MSPKFIPASIYPLKLFPWEFGDHVPGWPDSLTPEQLLRALCSSHVSPDISKCKERYVEISALDQDLTFFFEEPGLLENVLGPLRQAKTNYLLGNYVGSIALCGIVAEKMAIVLHAMSTPDEAERQKFEDLDQRQRIKELKRTGLVDEECASDYYSIKESRRRYLHRWNVPEERTAKQALRAYGAALRLVSAAIDYNIVDGKLYLSSKLMHYLNEQGVTTDVEEAE